MVATPFRHCVRTAAHCPSVFALAHYAVAAAAALLLCLPVMLQWQLYLLDRYIHWRWVA